MNTKIHLCILTTAHAVDDVRVNNKFAHSFQSAGFRITWVGPANASFDSKGFNRYGVRFLLTRPNTTRLDRLLAARRIGHLAEAVTGVDVYYAPDPDSASLALRLSRKNAAKVIYDIHEAYHGPMLDRWLMGLRHMRIQSFVRERIAKDCSLCDLVVAVNDTILTSYITPSVKSMVVRSCAPAWFAEGPPADVCGTKRRTFSIMHGKARLQRGTIGVLHALQIACREAPNLRVVMLTHGDPTQDAEGRIVLSRTQDLGIAHALDLRKGIPMQEMPSVLRSCDVGLIGYGRDLGTDSLPNRLFEYMAVGIPVIAPVYAAEIAKIITNEKCGVLADFEDPSSVAAAIVHLYRNPDLCRQLGQQAREAFLARHNWEKEVRPLLDRIRSWFPDRG